MSAPMTNGIAISAAPGFDVVVVGGGPVGFASALALEQAGARVALLTGLTPGAPPFPDRGRTAALMQGSLGFLASLGIEREIEAASWPLAAIRMIDAKGGLLQAPTVTFRAIELGVDAFGRNVPNGKLVAILRARTAKSSVAIIDDLMSDARFGSGSVMVTLASGSSIEAKLAIAADGRRSKLRTLAGIEARQRETGQTALTFHVSHPRDHEDVSTEFHTREGPFTLVPLGPGLSSVVWVVAPRRGRQLLALDAKAFARAAERECRSMLGAFRLETEPGSVPLHHSIAARFTGARLALAGEAAHAFPPIGAQGLNLGLRDAADLGKLDLSGSDLSAALRRYDRARRIDARSRDLAVDLLNRSLLSGLLPVDGLRALGLTALQTLSPLRKVAMRLGMGLPPVTLADLPRLGREREARRGTIVEP